MEKWDLDPWISLKFKAFHLHFYQNRYIWWEAENRAEVALLYARKFAALN